MIITGIFVGVSYFIVLFFLLNKKAYKWAELDDMPCEFKIPTIIFAPIVLWVFICILIIFSIPIAVIYFRKRKHRNHSKKLKLSGNEMD